MATVDEDMSEGREALESQVKQHQSATNLNDSVLHLWTEGHGSTLDNKSISKRRWNLEVSIAHLSTLLALQ